jgi:hypothetical protein
MQFHHVQNLSNKDYIFHDFLSAQQHQVKISLRTKFELQSNSANVTSSNDFLLIFRIKHN